MTFGFSESYIELALMKYQGVKVRLLPEYLVSVRAVDQSRQRGLQVLSDWHHRVRAVRLPLVGTAMARQALPPHNSMRSEDIDYPRV